MAGVPPAGGGGAVAAATAAAAVAGAPLSGASAAVGGGGGGMAEGIRLPSPLGFTPSPNRLRPCAAGRGGAGAAGGGGAGWTGDSRYGDGHRNSTDSTVFVFESEDDSSTTDPSERDGILAETSSLAVDTFHSGSGGSGVISVGSGGGGASCSGWEGAGGGGGGGGGGAGGGRLCRGGRWKTAAGTPPNAALQPGEFNLMLSSRAKPVSTGSGMESVSPLMTPRSPTTPASCSSTSPCASDGSFSTSLSRPQSAEKRQFLMRVRFGFSLQVSVKGTGWRRVADTWMWFCSWLFFYEYCCWRLNKRRHFVTGATGAYLEDRVARGSMASCGSSILRTQVEPG